MITTLLDRRRMMMGAEASPFNAAVTAFLKSNYAAYWEQISAYALSNSDIVPYVNEYVMHDGDSIFSMIPTLGVYRGLKSDGVAYILANYYPQKNADVILRAKGWSDNNFIFGSRMHSGSYSNLSFAFAVVSNTKVRPYMHCVGSQNTNYVTIQSIGATDIVNYKTNGSKFTLNGNEYNLPTRINADITKKVALFALNSNGEIVTKNACSISNWSIVGKPVNYIAYIKNNVNGMLDMATDTFYTNAATSGSFSIVKVNE